LFIPASQRKNLWGIFCDGLHWKTNLGINFLMALITGVLWYGQFFFYGLGHVRLGDFQFSSWAIHMIMLVLFSTIAGLVMKEWKMCSTATMRFLILALLVLVAAVLMLTYGNYLGGTN